MLIFAEQQNGVFGVEDPGEAFWEQAFDTTTPQPRRLTGVVAQLCFIIGLASKASEQAGGRLCRRQRWRCESCLQIR